MRNRYHEHEMDAGRLLCILTVVENVIIWTPSIALPRVCFGPRRDVVAGR